MKKIKSLTCLILTLLVSACNNGRSSAAFSSSSSSLESSNSEVSSSSSNSSSVAPKTPYNGYYDDLVSWTNGVDLKNQLNAIIRKGYTPLTYVGSNAQNYATNIDADHTKYDFEYLDAIYTKSEISIEATNKGWQREHAFCASLMCGSLTADAVKQKGRATDFHNLFAAEAGANGSRGNKNYGYADKSASNYTNRTVDDGYDGYSYSSNFEPGNKDKGRLARAIFYMATMYKDAETDEVNGITMKGLKVVEDPVTYVAGNDGAFAIGNLNDLLDWNDKYDVDTLEMQHNISVYSNTNNPDGVAQGNRNPYVDYPELVDYVFGSKKEVAGSLKDLTPSSIALETDKNEISHYAIKEAKRTYSYGNSFNNNDYKVVAVYKNFATELATSGISNNLEDYTFSEDDGDSLVATIRTPINTIYYEVSLNPLGGSSTGEIALNTDGIDKSKPGEEQEVRYGDIDFLLTYESKAATPLTITNITGGGVTFGSGTKPITKVTLKTKNSYKINAAYVKAFRGNASSSYELSIKVGDNVLLATELVKNADSQLFGARVNEPLTGQLSFVFEGSSSIKINSIAFDYIIE